MFHILIENICINNIRTNNIIHLNNEKKSFKFFLIHENILHKLSFIFTTLSKSFSRKIKIQF